METQPEIRCPSCGHRNRSERRYCAQCGGRLGEVCSSCGTLNETGERFCGHCGASLTGTAAEGERRQLTVLFCDLVGSTAIAGQLDPEDWREIAAEYQRAAAETVTRFGGHVAKYLGDGLLVYFGYPQAHEDDPERAVRAGLALIDTVAELNHRLEPAHGVRLAVRVGMHTGPVVIGEGAGAGAEVFGDTPNVAARVQALADPDAVLITEATHRLVSGRFIVEAKGAPPLKGVRQPVAVFRVVQSSGVRSRLAAAGPRGLTPFVGREAERRLLGERWAQAQAGEGQVVLITGEAGIGKSRLVQRFKEDLGGEPHTWLEAAGSPYHQQSPFYALTEMLGQALTGRGDESVEERIVRLEQSLAAAGLQLSEALPLVAPLLDLAVPERYAPPRLSPEAQRKKLLATLVAWLLGLARRQPAVAVLEDLQWVDPSTLELQALLAEQGATARVLFLYTARPEFRAPWALLAHHAQVTLGRLGRAQVREMVASVAARATLAELIDAVVTRTDGVPLFVEELTKAVLEAEGSGVASERTIPATLQDSLMARLDRLGPAKEVAQVAAVIGREFSYALLAAVSPLAEADLQASLHRLVDAELLYARGVPPDAHYVFKHALVQDTAYGSLLKRTRQQLHGRIVDVLVERFPARVAAEPEVVARHAEAAGRIDEAISYLQRAGEQAQTRSAHGEAITQLRKAIALLATRPEGAQRDTHEAALQLALAGSLIPARGFAHPEGEAAFERAQILCEAVDDAGRLGLARIGLASIYYNRGEVERGRVLAVRVLTAAEQSGDRKLALLGHDSVSNAEFYQGKFASALSHCEAARALYVPGQRDALLSVLAGDFVGVSAMSYGAWALWALGWPDRALARVCEAVVLARQLADQFGLAFALFFETAVHWLRRDLTAQRERGAETIALSEEQGFPLFLGLGRAFHAAVRAAGGESNGVADVLAGLALGAETGNQGGAPTLFALLGEVYMATGQLTEAHGAIETGLAIAAQTGQPFWDADLYRLQGEILLSTECGVRNAGSGNDNPQSHIRNPQVEAEALFQRALEIARAQEAKSFELRTATSLARLLRAQGRAAEAHTVLAPVYAWFTEGFDTGDLIEAKALLDELG